MPKSNRFITSSSLHVRVVACSLLEARTEQSQMAAKSEAAIASWVFLVLLVILPRHTCSAQMDEPLTGQVRWFAIPKSECQSLPCSVTY